jgi:MFS family permease
MNRDLLLVAFSLTFWGIGEGMFLLFQPLYLQELGANPVMIGGILSVIGIAMSVAHLPAGYLADRFGRRPVLITAWFIGTTAAWVMALSKTLPVFVLGSALYGMTSFVIGPLNSYITAARGNWSVGRALTLISAIYNIGAVLGPILGGWIGEYLGLRTNYQVAAFVFMFSTAMILFIRPQPIEPVTSSAEPGRQQSPLNTRFLRYALVIFIVMFSMSLAQPLSQNFLQNERGVSLMQIGRLISVRSIGIVLLNLTLGPINARIGFLISQATMGLSALLLWQGTGMLGYALGYLLMGSQQTARALASAQGRVLVQAANMGIAYGTLETVSALAYILAPPLAGYLYTREPELIYSASLVFLAVAILVTLLLSPVKVKDLAPKGSEV